MAGDSTMDVLLPQLTTLAGIIALAVSCYLVFKAVAARWVIAKPNEWLLLIKGGNLVRCGIGESCFRPLGGQVVTFTSNIQETTFTASQATNQRAGVSVTGKAYWSIYRQTEADMDGPFRAYKNLTGLAEGDFQAGNEKVQTLAISTIRDAVSQMSIVEVMTKREALKEKVKADITPIFRGWGIWLETVEILDVRVESRTLFDDMQYLRSDQLAFDTKADAHLTAEQSKLAANARLDAERLESSTRMAKKQADAAAEQGLYEAAQRLKREEGEAKLEEGRIETNTALGKKRAEAAADERIFAAGQQLKREEGEAALEEARQAMRLAKMAKDQAVRLQAAGDAAEAEDATLRQRLAVAKAEGDAAHAALAARYELEKNLTPMNLQKAALDATAETYAKLPLREVKLVSLGGGGGGGDGGLGSLIPTIKTLADSVSMA